MKAVLFVGHGSKDAEGNDQVRKFIESMKDSFDKNWLIETCFLEFEEPTILQGIDTCVEKGASHVALVPIILLQAGHSKLHIPTAIDEAKKKYPKIQFTYGKPLGIHDEAIQICLDRLKETGIDIEAKEKDTAVLLLGRGGSDPDANSDLCKIARLLWEYLPYDIVEPAFIGVTNPSLDEGIERCMKLGAKKIIVLPYFLFTGILIKRLENKMDEFKSQFPTHEFMLANYFGYHDGLKKILKERAIETLENKAAMNCDTCQYRFHLSEAVLHHHHHHHH